MPGSWTSFHSLAIEFHLGKCYSDSCKKRVVFAETGQGICAFRAKETYIWEVLSQWWKKGGQNRKSISSVMLWIITTDTLRCYTQFAPPDTLQTDKASETDLCDSGWDVQTGY